MSTWDELQAENASDHTETLSNESCKCGVLLADHYDRRGQLLPCSLKRDMTPCTKCRASTYARSGVCLDCSINGGAA